MTAIHRYADPPSLAAGAARRLLQRLIQLQADGRVAQLCLTGGRIANRVYAELGTLIEGSDLDPGRLELWWGDERFLPTDDPLRNAGPTLVVMAGRFPLDPARTHPMPAADGRFPQVSNIEFEFDASAQMRRRPMQTCGAGRGS